MVGLTLWIATILGSIIAIAPETYLDTRIYDREQRLRKEGRYVSNKPMQDKTGQMPWRIITFLFLDYGIISTILGMPYKNWDGISIWLLAVLGVVVLSIGVAWITLNGVFNLHINKPLSFTGTTSEIDKRYGDDTLKYQIILIAVGSALIGFHSIILV